MKNFWIIFLSSLSLYAGEKFRSGVISIAPYGTHFPALATVVAHTTGPILEMGCGDYSTPLLHALCSPTQRLLVSAESNKAWLSVFMDLQRSWHTFVYVPAYEKEDSRNNGWFSVDQDVWDLVGNDVQWSVVFVDHSPCNRRVIDIQRLRKNTDIFVIHDTEDKDYHYELVINTFKYKYVYENYLPLTAIVSDTIDVAQFFEA